MATPAPPISTPAPSRTRDWGRTGDPGSAFSGLGRGGRGGGGGGGRGRSRGGGRGRGGSPANASAGSSTPRTPSSAPKPAASEGSNTKPTPSKPATTTSGSTSQKLVVSSSTPTTPARAKGQSRKTSRSVVPTVVLPAAAPRPSNRRRRSQQLNSKGGGNAAGLKVNVPSLDDNLLRPQNRLDAPPHLAGSFDMRNNIDALVERVRAVAMDNRPSTPGSHIDWAGDDDEGLPDLDDWGVTASVGDKDEMISPIIVDGLKPLPEPVAKPPTPSGGVKEEIAAPFVMEDQSKQPQPSQTPLHPSLPPKPITGPIAGAPHSGRGNNNLRSPAKPATAVDTHVVPPHNGEPVKSSVDRTVKDEQDDGSDSGREGLAASIHAPTVSDSLSAPSNHTTPRNFNPTHNRAQTVGRVFPQTAPVNFNSRSRSGTSTPRGGGQHTRTHSSPPAGSVLGHRPSHSRPVITGDAISRLARTIAVSTPRTTPPISASNI
ncbi:proline/serine-rich protein [Mycena polygramma]|nr:proline/serine-rich protein [Mycena polygramma]